MADGHDGDVATRAVHVDDGRAEDPVHDIVGVAYIARLLVAGG